MTASLFDPVRIGQLQIANRFVRSATWEGMCDQDGRPTPRLVDYYARLAAGGTGLLISGYTYVRADGKQLPGKMGIDSNALLAGLKDLCQGVHRAGGRIFCQLVHAGGQTSAKVIGKTPLAPSAVEAPNYPEKPETMSPADIEAIVAAFADGARRAREAGFDGVQLHAAHGYLINQFLSPLMNRRGDGYGGPLDNRLRFLQEVYAAVRRAVGADYPVTVKLTAADHLEGGLSADDGVEIARRLDRLGIDAIEVSSGTAASGDATPVRLKIDAEQKEGYNVPFARRIKEAVAAPIIVVGGLRTPQVMETFLAQGDADLFALSRPLIREPELVRRWADNDRRKATCISCNGCFRPGLKEGGIYCVVDKIERDNRNPPV